jgi:hypothetical protein
MTEEITPTLTLAKLYETQNELIDAVNIYFKLNKNQNSQELEIKIQQLTNIIFENINRNYDSTISQIFSKEELRYFKIIPGSNVHIANSDQDTFGISVFDISENDSGEIDSTAYEDDEIINDRETSISYNELDAIEKKLKQQQLEQHSETTSAAQKDLELERKRLLQQLEQINIKLNDRSQSQPNDAVKHPGSAELDIAIDVNESDQEKSIEINQKSLNRDQLKRDDPNPTNDTEEKKENF